MKLLDSHVIFDPFLCFLKYVSQFEVLRVPNSKLKFRNIKRKHFKYIIHNFAEIKANIKLEIKLD